MKLFYLLYRILRGKVNDFVLPKYKLVYWGNRKIGLFLLKFIIILLKVFETKFIDFWYIIILVKNCHNQVKYFISHTRDCSGWLGLVNCVFFHEKIFCCGLGKFYIFNYIIFGEQFMYEFWFFNFSWNFHCSFLIKEINVGHASIYKLFLIKIFGRPVTHLTTQLLDHIYAHTCTPCRYICRIAIL